MDLKYMLMALLLLSCFLVTATSGFPEPKAFSSSKICTKKEFASIHENRGRGKENDINALSEALNAGGTVTKILSGKVTLGAGVAALIKSGISLAKHLRLISSKRVFLMDHRCLKCGDITLKCYNKKGLLSKKEYEATFEIEYGDSIIKSFKDNIITLHHNNWACELYTSNGWSMDQSVYWNFPLGKKEEINIYEITDYGTNRISSSDGSVESNIYGLPWNFFG